MSNDYTDYEDRQDDYDRSPRVPAMPGSVKFAGILWILFGALGLTLQAASFVIDKVMDQPAGQPDNPGSMCGVVCGVLISAVFLWVGLQTVRGQAKDTLGNAIGSMVFSLFYIGIGALMAVGGAVIGAAGNQPGQPQVPEEVMMIALVAGVVCLLLGGMLLLAGILALVGRSQYKDWRVYNRTA